MPGVLRAIEPVTGPGSRATSCGTSLPVTRVAAQARCAKSERTLPDLRSCRHGWAGCPSGCVPAKCIHRVVRARPAVRGLRPWTYPAWLMPNAVGEWPASPDDRCCVRSERNPPGWGRARMSLHQTGSWSIGCAQTCCLHISPALARHAKAKCIDGWPDGGVLPILGVGP